jgi:hypothetical protein
LTSQTQLVFGKRLPLFLFFSPKKGEMPPKNRKLTDEDRAEIRHSVLRFVNEIPSSVLRILSLKPSRRDREWAEMFAAQHPGWTPEFVDFAVDVAEGHRGVTLDRVMQELTDARETLAELGSFSGQLLSELDVRLRPFRESARIAAQSAASGRER